MLVGPGKTIACVIDLLLGEFLDHEEMLNGVARFAQFAVSCDTSVRSTMRQGYLRRDAGYLPRSRVSR